MPQYHEMM